MSALKSLTIDIGAEVREHNRLLKDVDDDFDSTTGIYDLEIIRPEIESTQLIYFFNCEREYLIQWGSEVRTCPDLAW